MTRDEIALRAPPMPKSFRSSWKAPIPPIGNEPDWSERFLFYQLECSDYDVRKHVEWAYKFADAMIKEGKN